MDQARLRKFVHGLWDDEVVPTLFEYIRIPNKSPAFDPDWARHGYMDDAVAMFARWAEGKIAAMPGARLDVVRLAGRTPVILIEIPGEGNDRVLLYGHLDKQPEMTGWAEGYGPWTPVIRGERLYGRGGADDGYALFGALAAIGALREQGISHAPAVILIEACEESGSYDLPYYVEHLAARIGHPSLVICLDSGCGNYDQLWLTTSLRGMFAGTLTVRVLEEGVHSGDASGIVPSSFRLLRQVVSRIENEATGEIRLPELHVQIPPQRIEQAKHAAAALGEQVHAKFPFAGGTQPMSGDLVQLILNRTWRPQLAVTGMAGLPEPANAGNVLLPYSTAKLSLRLPPTLKAAEAARAVRRMIEQDPPAGADISFQPAGDPNDGWHAPAEAPWLKAALERASQAAFGRPAAYMGEGGSIPFMAMLGARFPEAQFVITGVLGPHSNAHGPNEFLDIPTGKKVTEVIAHVLADHRHGPAVTA
ncbi:MAG: M20 family metallopeptidase [Alphaproteobacteria bacterium]|nr:M20 family metallopeptidase [Alphaproteobacteria bacterium]